MLRRSVRQLVPKRSWQNLSALATGQKNAEAWNEIKIRDAKVETTINAGANASVKKINFEEFEKTTSHPEIVAALKQFYNEQMALLAKLESEDNAAEVAKLTKGNEIINSAVSQLEKAVEDSEKIVQSGVKALWISSNNPDITRVRTNEWLDTDQYFQAAVERVAALNPQGYQFTGQKARSDKETLDILRLIDDRSDVKRRYNYMQQLHSSDYYDLHRRALLEHMTYYLLRTGGDVRFFPEIPPMNWMKHIESIRRNFAAVTHKTRAAEQLEKLALHQALELNPVEYSHGEEFFAHLVDDEARYTDVLVGKLMGHYGFLAAPFIPVRSAAELAAVSAKDNNAGEVYSFGDDVTALFYLPANKDLVRPVAAVNEMVAAADKKTPFLKGYTIILEEFAKVIELRGDAWMNAPGESLAEAFMRRLKADDPAHAIYAEYVKELTARVSKAQKVSKDAVAQKIATVEATAVAEEAAFQEALPAFVPSLYNTLKEQLASAEQLASEGLLNESAVEGFRARIAAADNAKDVLAL